MEDINEIARKLAQPFPENAIEWRVQQAGHKKDGNIYALVLAYVTNRAILDRLDEVMGIGNWENSFQEIKSGGLLCGISLFIDGRWVTKYDGADRTEVEPVKGMISGAEKRAGVAWGIGRYLYNLPTTFAEITTNPKDNRGSFKDRNKNKVFFYWKTPKMPKQFLPKGV